eukprot:3508759-Pleurochrysis_carterae.AAC.1
MCLRVSQELDTLQGCPPRAAHGLRRRSLAAFASVRAAPRTERIHGATEERASLGRVQIATDVHAAALTGRNNIAHHDVTIGTQRRTLDEMPICMNSHMVEENDGQACISSTMCEFIHMVETRLLATRTSNIHRPRQEC